MVYCDKCGNVVKNIADGKHAWLLDGDKWMNAWCDRSDDATLEELSNPRTDLRLILTGQCCEMDYIVLPRQDANEDEKVEAVMKVLYDHGVKGVTPQLVREELKHTIVKLVHWG